MLFLAIACGLLILVTIFMSIVIYMSTKDIKIRDKVIQDQKLEIIRNKRIIEERDSALQIYSLQVRRLEARTASPSRSQTGTIPDSVPKPKKSSRKKATTQSPVPPTDAHDYLEI